MINIFEDAKEYATSMHSGQKRKNGNDYIVHPISVSDLLAKYKMSHNIEKLKAVAILHDVFEDTDASYYDIVNMFGYDIAGLVLELTNNDDMKNELGKEKYLAYKLKHMTSWALAIKLCDRLDNVSDLHLMDECFRERYAKETMFVIDYILNNRSLSGTHKIIINDILVKIKSQG